MFFFKSCNKVALAEAEPPRRKLVMPGENRSPNMCYGCFYLCSERILHLVMTLTLFDHEEEDIFCADVWSLLVLLRNFYRSSHASTQIQHKHIFRFRTVLGSDVGVKSIQMLSNKSLK